MNTFQLTQRNITRGIFSCLGFHRRYMTGDWTKEAILQESLIRVRMPIPPNSTNTTAIATSTTTTTTTTTTTKNNNRDQGRDFVAKYLYH